MNACHRASDASVHGRRSDYHGIERPRRHTAARTARTAGCSARRGLHKSDSRDWWPSDSAAGAHHAVRTQRNDTHRGMLCTGLAGNRGPGAGRRAWTRRDTPYHGIMMAIPPATRGRSAHGARRSRSTRSCTSTLTPPRRPGTSFEGGACGQRQEADGAHKRGVCAYEP